MNFYEVANGWMGESYVSVFVWAKDKAQALELAQASYEKDGRASGCTPDYWDPATFRIEHLFSADASAFATNPSGSGYSRDKE